MVSVKYVLIVLRADDEGEGGTFAIYSLLSRYVSGTVVYQRKESKADDRLSPQARIVRRDPREEHLVKMERVRTSDLKGSSKSARQFLEKSKIAQVFLKVIGVLGVSLVMSDGILTPAQSVLGAIQGLKIVKEDITTSTIVGTSCGILILLFLIQPLGISKIASVFAPVVMIWLLFNFSFGVYNLIHFDSSVLKAFSPFFAGDYMVRNKTEGWKSLGGILLAFTGVEALFADLGAFSRGAVQLSWHCFAYPCLLLAYIGQAAYISSNTGAYSNPFFSSTPPGMFYPSLVVAVLAAIVASQTMITATFQLLSQIIKLSYFPQIKVVHTSKTFHNQIYIPWVNWLLMIGTIAVTAAYNNTAKLGEAYGVCVILVTFITTTLVSLVALVVWHLPLVLVLAGFLVFSALDGLYLSSALVKVPDGAWFTLALAVVLANIFILWRYGKENQWQAEASDRMPFSTLYSDKLNEELSPSGTIAMSEKQKPFTPIMNGTVTSSLKGMGIFFDKGGSGVPTVFTHFLQKFQAAPKVCVFSHIRPLSKPTVPTDDRFSVSRCFTKRRLGSSAPLPDYFRVTLRHGYTDEFVNPDLGSLIYEHLQNFIVQELRKVNEDARINDNPSNVPFPPDVSAHEELPLQLRNLGNAYKEQVVYIVEKEQMRVLESGTPRGWIRRIALSAFLWLRSNSGSRVSNFNLDIEKLVEIGFVKVV